MSLVPSENDLMWMDLDRSHDEVDRWAISSTETRDTMCLSDRLVMAKLHFEQAIDNDSSVVEQ